MIAQKVALSRDTILYLLGTINGDLDPRAKEAREAFLLALTSKVCCSNLEEYRAKHG